jgi:YVTN family beta-propeller protein
VARDNAPTAQLKNHVYVTNCGSGTASVIDTATDTSIGDPIKVGDGPVGVGIAPY